MHQVQLPRTNVCSRTKRESARLLEEHNTGRPVSWPAPSGRNFCRFLRQGNRQSTKAGSVRHLCNHSTSHKTIAQHPGLHRQEWPLQLWSGNLHKEIACELP